MEPTMTERDTTIEQEPTATTPETDAEQLQARVAELEQPTRNRKISTCARWRTSRTIAAVSTKRSSGNAGCCSSR